MSSIPLFIYAVKHNPHDNTWLSICISFKSCNTGADCPEIYYDCFHNRNFCSATFLVDTRQAFNRVWRADLLFKIKRTSAHSYFHFFQSYLADMYFQIKYGEETSKLRPVNVGVPQGFVLDPLLYLVYAHDIPLQNDIEVAVELHGFPV